MSAGDRPVTNRFTFGHHAANAPTDRDGRLDSQVGKGPMIPEAFEDAHLAIGLVTVSGFLVSFALSHA